MCGQIASHCVAYGRVKPLEIGISIRLRSTPSCYKFTLGIRPLRLVSVYPAGEIILIRTKNLNKPSGHRRADGGCYEDVVRMSFGCHEYDMMIYIQIQEILFSSYFYNGKK